MKAKSRKLKLSYVLIGCFTIWLSLFFQNCGNVGLLPKDNSSKQENSQLPAPVPLPPSLIQPNTGVTTDIPTGFSITGNSVLNNQPNLNNFKVFFMPGEIVSVLLPPRGFPEYHAIACTGGSGGINPPNVELYISKIPGDRYYANHYITQVKFGTVTFKNTPCIMNAGVESSGINLTEFDFATAPDLYGSCYAPEAQGPWYINIRTTDTNPIPQNLIDEVNAFGGTPKYGLVCSPMR